MAQGPCSPPLSCLYLIGHEYPPRIRKGDPHRVARLYHNLSYSPMPHPHPHDFRKQTRLKSHDYCGPGTYFITLITQNRRHILSQIGRNTLELTYLGLIIEQEWMRIPRRRADVVLDHAIWMPDHVHVIIRILGTEATHVKQPSRLRPGSLGAIVGQFKSLCTKRARVELNRPDLRIWKRGYYDCIVRTQDELMRIRAYIRRNPEKRKRRRVGRRANGFGKPSGSP